MNRIALATSLATAATLVVAVPGLATAAPAAPAPAPPYTAMSIRFSGPPDGGSGSTVLEAPTDGLMAAAGPDGGFSMGPSTGASSAVSVQVNDGTQLVAGGRYSLAAGGIVASMHAGSESCQAFGELAVIELTKDPNGVLTTLAADISGRCGAAQIRYNATTPWSGIEAPEVVLGPVKVAHPGVGDAVVTVRGATPVTFGAATFVPGATDPAADFQVVQNACTGATVAPGDSCRLRVSATAVRNGVTYGHLRLADNTTVGRTAIPLVVQGEYDGTGTYLPVPPTRLADTRSTGTRQPVGPRGTIAVQVAGRAGIPATGVAAAVVNLTVTAPSTAGYLTAYANGTSRPVVSSVNFAKGWTGANLVTVPVGTDGKVAVYNNAGTAHVVVDVVGWYAADDSHRQATGAMGQQYLPADEPERLSDDRFPPDSALTYELSWNTPEEPLANEHIGALAVNVTAVGPTAPGFLSVAPGEQALSPSSTLNFATGETSPNMTIVPLEYVEPGMLGFTVSNRSRGATRVLVDLVGIYEKDTATGLRFRRTTPTRIMDTRYGTGLPGALGPKATRTMTAGSAVAGDDTWSLIANLTAVRPTATTYLTQWDGTTSRPAVSNLNVSPGAIRSGSSFVPLAPGNTFATFNNAGSVHVALDVMGTFEQYPSSAVLDPRPAKATASADATRTTAPARPAPDTAVAPVSTRQGTFRHLATVQ